MNPLAGVIGTAWATYKAHPRHLLTISFVIYVVAAVAQLLLIQIGWLGAVVASFVYLIAVFLLQASLVKAVEDLGDGRADLSFSQTLQAARPYLGRVAVASILLGLAVGIGLILLIIPGLLALTFWCLVVPVIVIENASIGQAFERSRKLVSGYGLQVFGTIVLAVLILMAVNLVIGLVLAPLPNGLDAFVSAIVSGTLVAPFVALVLTIGYFRLRGAPRPMAAPPPPAA